MGIFADVFSTENSEDKVLIQNLTDVKVNLLKELLEWHGEAYLGPTKRKILYRNNDTNCEEVSHELSDNTSIVEMIKNHLTNGRTSLNPGEYSGPDVGDITPAVAQYVSPDGKWDMNRAASWITVNSYPRYIKGKCGNCAKWVRMAIEAGGMSTVGRPVAACNYTRFLPLKGFKHIATLPTRQSQTAFSSSSVQTGDIAVMYHGKYGHICMWNGSQWISDFKQTGMWVYPGNGTCYIFRYEA